MITEYVMRTEELLELSRGIIRFSIVQEAIKYTDMAGRGSMTSPLVMLYLKYQALSIAEDPQRIIAMKSRIGEANRYTDDFKDTIKRLREEAPKEILQFLDKDGFVKGSFGTPGHSKREILEGGFE